jgi:hypothetical protein
VRAGIVNQAEAYRWSSARAHVTGQDSDQLLDMASWREICEPADWEQLLAREEDATEVGRLRHATRTGRPVAMARSSSKWSSVWDVACGSGSGEGRCGARLQWRRGTVTKFSTSRYRRRRTEFDNKTW